MVRFWLSVGKKLRGGGTIGHCFLKILGGQTPIRGGKSRFGGAPPPVAESQDFDLYPELKAQ